MTKKGILFVDDEPNILNGIKRMLRSLRKEYNLYFTESGGEALDLIEAENVDVIVSDMRMPKMDGAEFLTVAKERHPHIIRIMLTGQADDESVFRTVNVVHQFLTKPCDPDIMKDVITRSCVLRDLLTNSDLQKLISGIDHLPSLPAVYTELQEVLRREEATAEEVAEIIERDIGMTAKLLQLVNSSFFGLYQKVENPARAVKLLGFDTIKILVLGVKIFSGFKLKTDMVSLDSLQTHSMMVAQCSKKIAMNASDDAKFVGDCFLAGMLHDIGRLILVGNLQDEYLELVREVQEEGADLKAAERSRFNASHGEIGAYLVGLWGFTSEIMEAVAYHNDIASLKSGGFSGALAVHVADAFFYEHYPEYSIGAPAVLDTDFLRKAGLEDRVGEWADICAEVLEREDDSL